MTQTNNNFRSEKYTFSFPKKQENNIKFLYYLCIHSSVKLDKLYMEELHDIHMSYESEVIRENFLDKYPSFDTFCHSVLCKEYKEWKVGCEINDIKYMILGNLEDMFITVVYNSEEKVNIKTLIDEIEDIVLS